MDQGLFDDGETEGPMTPMTSIAMVPAINAIISTAIIAALKRAPSSEVALGIVDALRRLRHAIDEDGGYTMAAGFDGMVRNHLLSESLVDFRIRRSEPVPIQLPKHGAKAADVSAILISAAESCLTMNALAPDNTPIEAAVRGLIPHLIHQMGGIPAWGALLRELRRPMTIQDDMDVAIYPGVAPLN